MAEILVSLALLSLIMVAMDVVLRSGVRYMRHTTLLTELQQSSVLAISRLTAELLETNENALRGDEVSYVAFGSPRSPDGGTTFDGANNLQWHKVVAYYIAPYQGETALYRKERAFPTPNPGPPIIDGSENLAYWMAAPFPRQMVAERVYHLDVVSSTTIDVIIGVRSLDGQFVIIGQTNVKARN